MDIDFIGLLVPQLIFLPFEEQKRTADHNLSYASLYGNVDRLPVLNRQLDRS